MPQVPSVLPSKSPIQLPQNPASFMSMLNSVLANISIQPDVNTSPMTQYSPAPYNRALCVTTSTSAALSAHSNLSSPSITSTTQHFAVQHSQNPSVFTSSLGTYGIESGQNSLSIMSTTEHFNTSNYLLYKSAWPELTSFDNA